MFALGAGGEFQAIPEQVEALCDGTVLRVSHVIERADGYGIVGKEDEFVTECFPDVFAQQALSLRAQVALFFWRWRVTLFRQPDDGFFHGDSWEGTSRNGDFRAEVFGDCFAVGFLHCEQYVAQPLFFKGHEIHVGADPRNFNVYASEFGVVARGERGVRPEDGANFKDFVETGSHVAICL